MRALCSRVGRSRWKSSARSPRLQKTWRRCSAPSGRRTEAMVTLARPGSAREAQGLKDALGAAAAFAGGATALQLAWSSAPVGLTLIDVNTLAEAQGIGHGAGALRIGAATRLEALRRDPRVRADAPLLAQACESLAALSVRNLATLGGNLGWRC
ncbi:MAG: hypothetical protein EOO24_67515, partial [Comamonadaceae bacterium]